MVNEECIKKWFAEVVAEQMEDKELRPYHIAYLCQFKNNGVYQYLNGRLLPNPWQLVLMAEIFGCTVDGLLGYETSEDFYNFERYKASEMYSNAKEYSHCFADRLDRYLRVHGIGVGSLSERSGVSIKVISQWMAFQPRLPQISQLLTLCEALGCTPTELLGY